MGQEFSGNGLRVLAGQGVEQQKLQDLVIPHGIHTVLQKVFAKPLAVAIVFAHGGSSYFKNSVSKLPYKIRSRVVSSSSRSRNRCNSVFGVHMGKSVPKRNR